MYRCLFRNIRLVKSDLNLKLTQTVNHRTTSHITLAHLYLSLNKKLAPYFYEKKKKVIYINNLKTCRECVNEIKKELGEYRERGVENEEKEEKKEKKEKEEKKEIKESGDIGEIGKSRENIENGGDRLNRAFYKKSENDEIFHFVGLDLEGYKIGRNGIVSIIQICTTHIYIFDLFQCSSPYQIIEYLKEILENEKIIKVTHDCREDCSILYNQYRVNVTNVFDTQVAYNIFLKKERKEVYQISYDDLLFQCFFANNSYKVYFHKLMKLDNKVFLRRPISNELIQYAVEDVLYLKPLMYVLLQKLRNEENLKIGKDSFIHEGNNDAVTSPSFFMKHNYFEFDKNTTTILKEVLEESKKYISYKFLNDHITDEKKLEKGMSLNGMVVSTNHFKIYVKLNLNRNGVILNSFNYKCEVGDIIRCVVLGFSGPDFINLGIHPSLLTLNENA